VNGWGKRAEEMELAAVSSWLRHLSAGERSMVSTKLARLVLSSMTLGHCALMLHAEAAFASRTCRGDGAELPCANPSPMIADGLLGGTHCARLLGMKILDNALYDLKRVVALGDVQAGHRTDEFCK